jgi:hypothetical protein
MIERLAGYLGLASDYSNSFRHEVVIESESNKLKT